MLAIGRDRTLSHAAWYERQQLWRFLCAAAETDLRRKTMIRRADGYHDHGNNWLLLWDKLSLNEPEFLRRTRLLHTGLNSYWTEENQFDLIIIESEEFRRFAILTPGEPRWLPDDVGL